MICYRFPDWCKLIIATMLAIFLLLISIIPVYAYKTLDDIELLARLVWLEARGESDKGQQAVVQVVINRLDAGHWGDTLHSVVFAAGQFSRAKSIPKVQPTDREYRNVQAVLEASEPCLPPWVMYFSSRGKHQWDGYKCYTKIGGHWFGGFKKDRKAYEKELATQTAINLQVK